jgi:hypothetical protein
METKLTTLNSQSDDSLIRINDKTITTIARQFLDSQDYCFAISIVAESDEHNEAEITLKRIKEKIQYLHNRKLALLHNKLPTDLLSLVNDFFALNVGLNDTNYYSIKRGNMKFVGIYQVAYDYSIMNIVTPFADSAIRTADVVIRSHIVTFQKNNEGANNKIIREYFSF